MDNIRALKIEQWLELCKGNSGVPVFITLDGASMQPIIRRGKDTVRIIPLNRRPKTGDIVLFFNGKNYVVHRIVKTSIKSVITRGDNTNGNDRGILKDDILGLATERERNGKKRNLDTPFMRCAGLAVSSLNLGKRKLRAYISRMIKGD